LAKLVRSAGGLYWCYCGNGYADIFDFKKHVDNAKTGKHLNVKRV